jgi:hypothetical protein
MTMIIDGSAGITFPNSTTQASGGKVIQVVSSTLTSQATTTSGSFVSTGLTASITPLFSTSKIYVLVSAATQCTTSNSNFSIYRNSTNLGDSTTGFGYFTGGGGTLNVYFAGSILDTPATTSSTTYTLYYKTGGGTLYVNNGAGASTITLLEIAQ